MLHVFDLDDTLVQYGHSVNVPKQTFHCLRALKQKGCDLGIISFNPLGKLVASQVGLTPFFFSRKHVVCDDAMDREELMFALLKQMNYTEQRLLHIFHYWDDRQDNLQIIREFLPNCKTHHVPNPRKLYLQLKDYLSSRAFCKHLTCWNYEDDGVEPSLYEHSCATSNSC